MLCIFSEIHLWRMTVTAFRNTKWFDVFGQLGCVLLSFPLMKEADKGGGLTLGFLVFYFLLGAWQAISCLVWRFATPRGKRGTGRIIYEIALLIVLVVSILLGSLRDFTVFQFLLVVPPFMAVYYFILTIYEALRPVGDVEEEPLARKKEDE